MLYSYNQVTIMDCPAAHHTSMLLPFEDCGPEQPEQDMHCDCLRLYTTDIPSDQGKPPLEEQSPMPVEREPGMTAPRGG